MKYRWTAWVSMVLLGGLFGFLMYNAWAQSPTMDEQNHIARGYALLRTGDPRLSLEHPPLINVIEALPLLLLGHSVQLPLDDWSWEAGQWYYFADNFLWFANHDADRMVFLARVPVVMMTVLLAALAARWARELWGGKAGVVGLMLVAFDPNILAHGSLATTDIGITLTAFLAGYAVWRLTRAFSWRGAMLAGLALGAMLASKVSALMFWGIFGVLAVGDALREGPAAARWHALWKRLVLYAAVTAVAVLFLWASYMFQIVPAVENGTPVPLGTYVNGVLTVLTTVEGGRTSYLLGATSLEGWPLYFPITFAVKTPIPVMLLILLTVPLAIKRRRGWAACFLLLPVVLYWFFALRSALNVGYRHLLPTLPFVYVWVAQWGGSVPENVARQTKLDRIAPIVLGVSLGWLALETFWIAPHFLSYFNAIGGGPENGWRIVADSNIDWGQDLKTLSAYIAEHNLGKVKLSWFGSARPEAYGIAFDPLPGLPHYYNMWLEPPTFNEQHPEPGVYVISVSNLVELTLEDKHFFTYFRAREPDARVGYSVYIYRVEEP